MAGRAPGRPAAREITDHSERLRWEYLCQASLRSVDVHVSRAWLLADGGQLQRLRALSQQLEGPTVYSLLDAEELLGEGRWQDALDGAPLGVDWAAQEFPLGVLPRSAREAVAGGVRRYVVCRVALGRSYAVRPGQPPRFPDFFSSCLMESGSPPVVLSEDGSGQAAAEWRRVYRLRSGEQVVPACLCEVVFEQRPVQLQPPLCDVCNSQVARLYCKNDNAHFCARCDAKHHTENAFFARHQRFDMKHSPFLYGFCPYHPSERLETACLQCRKLLCKLCNQIGPHATPELGRHTLVSTTDSFAEAMSGSAEADRAAEARRAALVEALVERDQQLADAGASFEEAQLQLDVLLRGALDQLGSATARKREVLQSVKRQLNTGVMFLQWLQSFQRHARSALPAADFVVAARRHEQLLVALFGEGSGGPAAGGAGLLQVPPWVDEELRVEGHPSVQLATLPPPMPGPGPSAPRSALPWEAAALAPAGGARADAVVQPLPAGAAVAQGAAGGAAAAGGEEYMEATPRRKGPGGRATPPSAAPLPAGVGGVSDTLYSVPAGSAQPALAAALAAPAEAGPHAAASAAARNEYDSYIREAFAYLDQAQRQTASAGEGPRAAAPAAAGGGPRAAAQAPAALPPQLPSLALAGDLLAQLRQGGGGGAGARARPWGSALELLQECPGSDRNELMLRCLRVSAPFGSTSSELVKAVVRHDVTTAQVASLLASVGGLQAALVHALLRLPAAGQGLAALSEELGALAREVELARPGDDGAAQLHAAIEGFLARFNALARSEGGVPPPVVALCHFLYAAAEEKFGLLGAQNAVATLLVGRVVTPLLLRVARRGPDGGAAAGRLSERASELSRTLQRVAHFAHHDEEGRSRDAAAGPPDLDAVMRHVRQLRDVVSTVLSRPAQQGLTLGVTPEQAEDGAKWIVGKCRGWSTPTARALAQLDPAGGGAGPAQAGAGAQVF